jgi:hypothetical protein
VLALHHGAELSPEALREAALREPAVERGVHQSLELRRTDHAPGDRHGRLPGHERLGLERRFGEAAHGVEGLGSERLEAPVVVPQRRTLLLAMRLL